MWTRLSGKVSELNKGCEVPTGKWPHRDAHNSSTLLCIGGQGPLGAALRCAQNDIAHCAQQRTEGGGDPGWRLPPPPPGRCRGFCPTWALVIELNPASAHCRHHTLHQLGTARLLLNLFQSLPSAQLLLGQLGGGRWRPTTTMWALLTGYFQDILPIFPGYSTGYFQDILPIFLR